MPQELIKTLVVDHEFWAVLRLYTNRNSYEHTELLFIQSNSEQALQEELDALSFLYDEADRDFSILATHKSPRILSELNERIANLQRTVVKMNEAKNTTSKEDGSKAAAGKDVRSGGSDNGSESNNTGREASKPA